MQGPPYTKNRTVFLMGESGQEEVTRGAQSRVQLSITINMLVDVTGKEKTQGVKRWIKKKEDL